jgi:hypothetical protein
MLQSIRTTIPRTSTEYRVLLYGHDAIIITYYNTYVVSFSH